MAQGRKIRVLDRGSEIGEGCHVVYSSTSKSTGNHLRKISSLFSEIPNILSKP